MRYTFDEFQKMSWRRCTEAFPPQCQEIRFLALAMAGEVGELCNIVKKAERGDFSVMDKRDDIIKEIADVMTYCDLLMTRLSADTGIELYKKFFEVSRRVKWPKADYADSDI